MFRLVPFAESAVLQEVLPQQHSFCSGDLDSTDYNLAARILPFISHANVEQYKTALEHISVRAGTAIPTGAAERALAVLYQRQEEAWPFLADHLADDAGQRGERASSTSGTQAKGTEDGKGDAYGEGERPVTSEPDGAIPTTDRTKLPEEESGTGQQRQQQRTGRDRGKKRSSSTTSSGEAVPESFSFARLSAALEAFARACEDRGSALEGLAVQDLMNCLYLGGQAKVSLEHLGAFDCGM